MNKDRVYFYLGILLLVAFFGQAAFDIKWQWLEAQQRNEGYKQGSGFLLMAYLMSQWVLAILRIAGRLQAAKRNYPTHKHLGVFAPLFFYFHSTRLGHAYLLLLSSVYFTNVVVGLFNRDTLNIKKRWFSYGWMILHVGLSVFVIILMAYHVFIAFSYH